MKKIELEKKTTRKKRFIFLVSLIITVTCILALAQLFLSNHLAGFGKELLALQKEEKALSLENQLLSKQIAKESSIATIAQKSHTTLLGKPSAFLVIEAGESVALLHGNGF